MPASDAPQDARVNHFIDQIIEEDLSAGRVQSIVTRFPPEPNGYLHIGHAKSICLNFGIAARYKGRCHLRMDDTNPTREEQAYIDAIHEDVRWLGFDWGEHEYYASDYFDQLYDWAVLLIRAGKAYVDDQSAEEISRSRGTLTRPGVESPCRGRTVEENLDLFERMRRGEFANGSKVLRAKIDMASPNINLRDPVMYRILHAPHPRTGEAWCIYPMYDWAHGQSDWIEGVTHSICTLEFESHRPLYDWFIEQLEALGVAPRRAGGGRPRQYEFARLNLSYTLMSKRRLLELVKEGHVRGWDDPRMPTISGMRRRGYTPAAIRKFAETIGVARRDNTIEVALLEHHLREDLNRTAPRRMAVLDPVRLVITNYDETEAPPLEAINNPEDPVAGTRPIPFGRELFIERDDFLENAPRQYFRLTPGAYVRLRYAYIVQCTGCTKDAQGNVVEVQATYNPATRGGDAPEGVKVKGTIHWVSAAHAVEAEVRLYDHLFTVEDPSDVPEGQDWRSNINPDSLRVIPNARVEPALADVRPGQRFQFERLGYFCVDPDSDAVGRPVFNRTVTLKDTWSKIAKKPPRA